MCVYFFCIFLSSFLSCATQKNSLTLFVIKDTKDDDDDDFDDFDDGAECEERPKSPKEGTDESANRFEFFFLRGGARALGLFGFQSRAFQKGPILNSDRSNLCVYNRYRFRLMGISLSLLRDWGRETLQQLLKSRRRFGVDRPKNAFSCCCFRAREREREREREQQYL